MNFRANFPTQLHFANCFKWNPERDTSQSNFQTLSSVKVKILLQRQSRKKKDNFSIFFFFFFWQDDVIKISHRLFWKCVLHQISLKDNTIIVLSVLLSDCSKNYFDWNDLNTKWPVLIETIYEYIVIVVYVRRFKNINILQNGKLVIKNYDYCQKKWAAFDQKVFSQIVVNKNSANTTIAIKKYISSLFQITEIIPETVR